MQQFKPVRRPETSVWLAGLWRHQNGDQRTVNIHISYSVHSMIFS